MVLQEGAGWFVGMKAEQVRSLAQFLFLFPFHSQVKGQCEKVGFTKKQSRLVSVVFDSVLGPPHLRQHI